MNGEHGDNERAELKSGEWRECAVDVQTFKGLLLD